jgi:hypothetical protein
MRKTLAIITAATALFSGAIARSAAPAREAVEPGLKKEVAASPSKPREPAKDAKLSDPVADNNVEFQAFAPPTWTLPAPGAKTRIELGLKVTNNSDKPIQFNVFDTISISLKDANGKEARARFMRDSTFVPPALTINKGDAALVFRDATLDGATLSGQDGSGGVWTIDGVKPGTYTLLIRYACDEKAWAPLKNRRATAVVDPKAVPFYVGTATTKDLAIEVTPPAPAAAAK